MGPPHQHVGESNVLDDLTLLVALDEHGNYHSANFTGNELDHLVGSTAHICMRTLLNADDVRKKNT